MIDRLLRKGTGGPGLLLQWQITERCNLRCRHCYQDDQPSVEMPLSELCDVADQYLALLRELGRDRGRAAIPGHITISGGEPFVRPDTTALLEYLASRSPRPGLAVLTNGSLIDQALARRLRSLRLRFVQLSLDGTEPTHDALRGAGSFARTLEALALLREVGLPVFVSFTAHAANYREFPAVAAVACRLGASRVWADRLIPCGRGAACETLSPEQAREFFGLMKTAREADRGRWRRRSRVPMHRALQFLGGGLSYRCSAGRTLLSLQPDGEVLACRRLPIATGNVRATPLRELWHGSPLFRDLRDDSRVPNGCAGCLHLAACRGGLRCLAFACTGDPWTADPGCWLAHSAAGATPAPMPFERAVP